jgi:HEXXH motif-containing protein
MSGPPRAETGGPPPWALPFSLPVQELDDRVLAAVAGTHAQALAELLITTYGEEIASCSEGLVDLVADWCRVPTSYDTAWDLAFGRVQLALTSGALDPREVAVRVALRLTETGVEGAWRGVIPPSTLRLGHLILPGIESVEVKCAAGRLGATVRAQNGTTVECGRREATGEWVADGVASLPLIGVTRSIYLLGASGLPPADGGEQGFEGVEPVQSIDTATIKGFQGAFEILADGVTNYLGWIERILRGILVSRREEAFRLVSGSADAVPGVIHASYPAGAMDIAEVLVHECAHQYFYLLERVGPLDDGSDPRLYWSPPLRRERPLNRILMAYHALANVWLFYDAVRAVGVDDSGYVDTHESTIADSVAQLDAPLRSNRALTGLGRALYQPLADRVAGLAA